MASFKFFKLETFSTQDGPGIRLVIFLCKCNYKCFYCHNLECNDKKLEKNINFKEIIKLYNDNKPYYKKGGITLSGGEPLLQFEECLSFSKICKKNNINLIIESNGLEDSSKYIKLSKQGVSFIINIKHFEIKKNKNYSKLIGVFETNKINYWLTLVVIKKVTCTQANIKELKNLLLKAKHCKDFTLLPLHTLAKEKYEFYNVDFKKIEKNIPSKKELEKISKELKIIS